MPKQHALRIFVVDDEPVIACTLTAILRRSGYGARSFTDPLEALRCALVEAPDLLISDVMMPGLSGVELAMEMKRISPGCSVLLLSALASMEDLLADARAQGHTLQLLSKPVHPTEILRWVQGHVLRLERQNAARTSSCAATGVSVSLLDAPRSTLPFGTALAF